MVAITIKQADITKLKNDVIVDAANRSLRGVMRCLAGMMLFAGVAQAAELSFQQGDGGKYSTTAAATIEERKGGRARLGKNALVALEAEYGKTEHKLRQGLLGFFNIIGTQKGQIPPGAKIHVARLTLVFENAGVATTPVTIFPMLKPWKEGEVCWVERSVGEPFGNASSFVLDNAAALRANSKDPIDPGGGMPGVDYSKTAIDARPSIKGQVRFDVTQAVQAWAAGRPNYGLYLQYLHHDSAQFHSDHAPAKEKRPLLKVSYTTDGEAYAPVISKVFLREPGSDVRLGPLTPGKTPTVELTGSSFSLDWKKVRDDWTLSFRSKRTGRTYGPFPVREHAPVSLGGIRLRVSGE